MIDNIYKVETVTNVDAATVKVACNVKSYASGIVTATTYAGASKGAALGLSLIHISEPTRPY